jgi:hypothetical protein
MELACVLWCNAGVHTVARRMKRSSIATLRNTMAFMICRAMKTVMNVPVRAHVAMVMMFDLSMVLEMSRLLLLHDRVDG